MTTRTRPASMWLLAAGATGFVAGMVVMAGLFTVFPAGGSRAVEAGARPAPSPVEEVRPSAKESPPAVSPPPETTMTMPAMSSNAVAVLRDRRLEVPVQGARREDLRNMFDEQRGASRRHEAIDLLAPRHTPVVAVEDGTIAKLFVSDAGGITLYQFDPTSAYCYYYAHLEGYADGLKEGDRVKRGDLLGYVGTTGNAPKDTPHLHFAIFQLTEKKQWWQGTPIDPYTVLR
ncbi:MAG: peptidoglycan DD-metalloendopeptidase family protein [Acidobacteriota bacterium]|nr:peptidoglycan DD-metalloendopeptidase family protein [Acidobacteriota bacterium]